MIKKNDWEIAKEITQKIKNKGIDRKHKNNARRDKTTSGDRIHDWGLRKGGEEVNYQSQKEEFLRAHALVRNTLY